MKKKTIALLLALALVFGGAVGGTIAWLTDKTDTVTNTFTTAGIGITLTETMKPDGTLVEAGVTDWSAQLVPGVTYTKNPTVSVVRSTTDVDIYLFVKFDVSDDIAEVLDYESALTTGMGWTQGKGASADDGDGIPTNVWYRIVTKTEESPSWRLLADKTTADGKTYNVAVKSDLNAATMPTTALTMEYTAYAIQTEGFANAAAAWEEISTAA